MSEAARRTYFHFSPTPPGEWKTVPPDSSGYYWVTWSFGNESEDRLTLVHYEPSEERLLPAGFDILDGESLKSISLERIRAWWSGKLTPPSPKSE